MDVRESAVEGLERIMTGVLEFFRGKKVFITGHTGFKGSWLCKILILAGADVTGYALLPPSPSLFQIAEIGRDMHSVIGDVRDYPSLKSAFEKADPQIVIHMAAQPLVLEGYKNPHDTYEINVMGSVNIMECVRQSERVRSFVNVTTDKVYKNKEWVWGYRENDELDGYDPYSNSKSCSELVTGSYRRSFFSGGKPAVSTVRAGNVIGGGDFSPGRIIPDCIRFASKQKDIIVRNPYSVRPYQHVLEPLSAYLMIAASQYRDPSYAGSYNIGPDEADCCQTGALADLFLRYWGGNIRRVAQGDDGPHEANFLKLDCSSVQSVFGWRPRWNLEQAVEKTVEWTKCWLGGGNARACMEKQIRAYFTGGR